MPKLIKDHAVVDHEWIMVRDQDELSGCDLTSGKWLVPVSLFETTLAQHPTAEISMWVSSDTDVESLEPLISGLPVIGVDFPTFMDGRGFSIARTLRDHLDYEGEIRAVGSFIPDQIFYLSRCGFNSFEFQDDVDEQSLLSFLEVFSESYQAGTDEPQPLFRRRA